MKKILALLLAGVMTVGLAACGTPADTSGGNSTADNGSAASGDTVVIGVFEPLSGDNGAGGKQEVLGMQYANSVTLHHPGTRRKQLCGSHAVLHRVGQVAGVQG